MFNKDKVKRVSTALFLTGAAGFTAYVATKMLLEGCLKDIDLEANSPKEYMGDVIKEIKVYCKDNEKAGDILSALHNQLKGNKDYVECNIILNDDVVIENNEIIGSVITCTVYKESESNPLLNIDSF